MRASSIMTSPVITVGPETPVPDIAALLFKNRISAVPVIEEGSLVGLVSESDLLHRHELGSEPWWRPARSSVIVTEGVVHYWGTIDSEDERDAARVAAENIAGVHGVDDRRRLFQPLPMPMT